jgi:uncharacterized membrane protein YedE/YeeE
MSDKPTALVAGGCFGFLLAWARLSDPAVIRAMLLLREADVFLIMGSAIAVAAVGVRLLRAAGLHAVLTGEPIHWSTQRPEPRHVLGSIIFGARWSVAGTCPGPVAAMIGEGHLAGLVVGAGLLLGVAVQPAFFPASLRGRPPAPTVHPAGL